MIFRKPTTPRYRRLLLVGCGRHALRNYVSVLASMSAQLEGLVVFDTEQRLPEIQKQIASKYPALHAKTAYHAVAPTPFKDNSRTLPKAVQRQLEQLHDQYKFDKMIVATDPEYHVAYITWGLRHSINQIVDKPISTPEALKSNPDASKQIYDDYRYIKSVLVEVRKKNPALVCNILAQRRYHLGFAKVQQYIEEIRDNYGVGITSFQSLHTDGQWRLPLEIISMDYHGYNRGYGKCLHSGYHTIDIVDHMVRISAPRKPHATNVAASFVYPEDYLTGFPAELQYKLLGKDLSGRERNLIRKELMREQHQKYGEISAHLTVDYRSRDGRKLASGTISMAHDGLTQRGWADVAGRDLYKGNGRIRQEKHYFASGPLQVIMINALESHEELNDKGVKIGKGQNFDVHVFRNVEIMPKAKPHVHFTIKDIYKERKHKLGDPMRDARTIAVKEFFSCVENKRPSTLSDLTSHEGTLKLLAQTYKNAGERFHINAQPQDVLKIRN